MTKKERKKIEKALAKLKKRWPAIEDPNSQAFVSGRMYSLEWVLRMGQEREEEMLTPNETCIKCGSEAGFNGPTYRGGEFAEGSIMNLPEALMYTCVACWWTFTVPCKDSPSEEKK